MKALVVFLYISITISPLFSQKGIDLTSDESLVKIFNEKEIKGLESMVRFVDNMVIKHTNETDVNKAYHLYLEEIAQTPDYIVPFEENVKYQFLKSLDSAQFATAWAFSHHVEMIRYRDTVYRNLDNFICLELKPFGKYMDYLEEVGKDDPYFKSLRQLMEDVGNLTPPSSEWFPENHANFDFNIPKNRLWAAIYLLRREDTYENK